MLTTIRHRADRLTKAACRLVELLNKAEELPPLHESRLAARLRNRP
jgi:hypothetical protein